MDTIGYHYVAEASGCDPRILEDPNELKRIMLEAAKIGLMDVRQAYFYRFTPRGVSGILVVSQSHISVHTWPEKGYAAVDVYVCGTKSKPEEALEYILRSLNASYAHITEIERGIEDEDRTFTHTILSWDEQPRKMENKSKD